MTPAELWDEYQPKFAEAKKRDNQEATLIFLIQPVKIGRFWIAPLSLRRLLYLEAFESPFVGGKSGLTKKDVLLLLWVLNPNFTNSKWRAGFFMARNWFINWTEYAEEIGALIEEGMAMMAGADASSEGSPPSSNWVSQMVDGFASQYHWPLDDILDMPLHVSAILGKAMGARLSMSKDDVSFSRHSDTAKSDYLQQVQKLTDAKKKEKKSDG